jgi:2-dehydro-3-deoxyphosphooctonate aldolase (KDO 8-P synthase)
MDDLYDIIKKEPFFIVGPCVIESEDLLMNIADWAFYLKKKLNVPIVFKASFDKANRTSIGSFRGPGLDNGLALLEKVKSKYQLPITTDIHESVQAKPAGEVVDIIQIFPVQKVMDSGNSKVMLTERGNMYGYNNLVVDFRNIIEMKKFNVPVVMDCTHSVQRPGGAGGKTGGNSEYVPNMALAAKAFGSNGYFFETHPDPDNALSDGPNMIRMEELSELILQLIS